MPNGTNPCSPERAPLPDQNDAKFLKIGQKMTETWPSKDSNLKEFWQFSRGKPTIKW